MKDYWDKQHADKNIRWLTGSSLNSYRHTFQISDDKLKDKVILEIGVGLGIATREISKIAKSLDALDISTVALDSVKDITWSRYTSPEQLPNNTYDIAISHLVAQHMCDRDLQHQLKHVLRSLKIDGTLLIQWADAIGDNGQSIRMQEGGGVLRSIDTMSKLIDNGRMEIIKFWYVIPNVIWYSARMQRAS